MAIETIATDEAVFNAANELSAAGKKASVRAIYATLGGGGMQTISAALRRWNSNRELKTTAPIELTDLPNNLLCVMHSATTEIWNAALAENKAEIEQLTLSFNARLLEAHQEREDALQELEEATQELETSKKECESWKSRLKISAVEVDNLNETVKKIREESKNETKRAETAEHQAETAEAVNHEIKNQVEQLNTLLNASHENEKTLHAALEKTQQEKAKIEGMLTVYKSIDGKSDSPPPAPKKPQARKVKEVNL
jgi:chromosome segregation ATPase